MYVIRAITEKDAEAFIKLAFQAGMGMTSLPKNREILLEKVRHATESFRKNADQPGDEHYLFVLQDLQTEKIVGACGIEAKTGLVKPLTFYRVEHQKIPALVSSTPRQVPFLRIVHYYNAPSEIGSLYLSPGSRDSGLGKLLSLSRFLFMASHLHRFDSMVFAEMRGFIDAEQASPFWEGVGRHFLDIRFATLLHIRDEKAIDLSTILPSYPIYVPLLPKTVQQAIGQVHPETLKALNMLIQEGFKLTEELDLFDGGPKIEAETKEIRTIKLSKLAAVTSTHYEKEPTSQKVMISNNLLNFKACYGFVKETGPQAVSINNEAAQALCLKAGDLVRYSSLPGIPSKGVPT